MPWAACSGTGFRTSSSRSTTSIGAWSSWSPKACEFVTSCSIGTDVSLDELRARNDAVLLACGALDGRDTPPTPGRELRGIHLAMEHLVGSNRHVAGRLDRAPIDAAGKQVVIIGGGDTAADCLGVAHRQGAAGVVQLDLYPQPPSTRDDDRDPWPTWPWILRSYPAHEEGGERAFAVAVQEFVGDADGNVRAIRIAEVTVQKVTGGARSPSCPEPNVNCRPTWCCWPSGSTAPRMVRCSIRSA